VAQIVDTSPKQIDVTKDFLVGSRAAWQDINAKGGLRGKTVRHLVLEVDADVPNSIRIAVDTLKGQPQCLTLFGSVGDRVASQLVGLMGQELPGMAHVAPWLQNLEQDKGENTFPIFASRQAQIFHAVKSLAVMGVSELGVVYASPAEQAAYRLGIEQAASALKRPLKSYSPSADLRKLGQTLGTDSPRVLIFLGGTPELAEFSQGISKQSTQRYVIAMSDVNLQTIQQMGTARQAAMIATQVVPLLNSGMPIVKHYRETLGRLYDEAPTALSLAGFVAARYTYEMLRSVDGPLTRQNVLQTLAKRSSIDLGGFHIALESKGRGGTYVTQSMVSPDGRIVG
jgi:ABC-type branched-subunit amino acid transport system substrate-binding protein